MHPPFSVKSDIVNLHVYLDERGTPGVTNRFIMGGVAVVGEPAALGQEWKTFAIENHWMGKKGTRFGADELLSVAEFLVTRRLIPIAIHSNLSDSDLAEVHEYSERYRLSNSPMKRVSHIPASVWLWQCHVPWALAAIATSTIVHFGRIGASTVHIDQFGHSPLKAHFRNLMLRNLSAQYTKEFTPSQNAPEEIKGFMIDQYSEASWEVDLNSKGPLSHLADVMCAMYGRKVEGEEPRPWDVLRLRYGNPDGTRVPVCLGWDATELTRRYIAKIGETIDRVEKR